MQSLDSLIVSYQRWAVREGTTAGTVIDTVATYDTAAAPQFALVEARWRGDGTDRNDTELHSTSPVVVQPSGAVVVRDPTHLLAVNGPLQLRVQATAADGRLDEEVITVTIADQRYPATPWHHSSWTVGQAAAYPPVKDPPGRQGVLEGQSVVVKGKLGSAT